MDGDGEVEGLKYGNKQPLTLTFTPTGKPEHPEETPAGT